MQRARLRIMHTMHTMRDQPLILRFDSATDVGRVRANNEDTVLVDPALGLVIVADGMGGHNGGEVASKMVTDIVRDYLVAQGARDALACLDEASSRQTLLREAIALANNQIRALSQSQHQLLGMGTTIVLGLFRHDQLTIAHVGDSRAYRLRHHQLEPLTRDHSSAQRECDAGLLQPAQMAQASNRHWLTRAVGVMPEVIVDFSEQTVRAGDSFLFCSDGLYEHLSVTTMCALLGAPEGGLNTACLQLIAAANAQGGRDNMSVVLVRAEKSKTSFFQARWRRIAPLFWRIRKTAFLWFEK